jgi:hypothetical protein
MGPWEKSEKTMGKPWFHDGRLRAIEEEKVVK